MLFLYVLNHYFFSINIWILRITLIVLLKLNCIFISKVNPNDHDIISSQVFILKNFKLKEKWKIIAQWAATHLLSMFANIWHIWYAYLSFSFPLCTYPNTHKWQAAEYDITKDTTLYCFELKVIENKQI